MERIKDLLTENHLTELELDYLTEVGWEDDEDGEEVTYVVDTIRINEQGELGCYDGCDVDIDGNIDPLYKVADFEQKVINDLYWNTEHTLMNKN